MKSVSITNKFNSAIPPTTKINININNFRYLAGIDKKMSCRSATECSTDSEDDIEKSDKDESDEFAKSRVDSETSEKGSAATSSKHAQEGFDSHISQSHEDQEQAMKGLKIVNFAHV